MSAEIAYLAFSERGRALAEGLRQSLGGTISCTRDGTRLPVWTAEQFAAGRALVFVGAAGIAVRAVAPYLQSKAEDPAVVAVDECGHFAVPLVSGHLGGANALSRRIAAACGATAAVTTATDASGVFAVDEWARVQGMAVPEPERIKAVSRKALSGEPVSVRSVFPIAGTPPAGFQLAQEDAPDVWVDVCRHEGLCLVPPALVLGTGCVRGAPPEVIEACFESFCAENRLWPQAFSAVSTLDRKANEPGLLAFCARHGLPLRTWTAAELAGLPGAFTASAFVEARVGVDNVCERSAVRAAGGGILLARKYTGTGVTMAAARKPAQLDWRLWED